MINIIDSLADKTTVDIQLASQYGMRFSRGFIGVTNFRQP